MCYCGATMLAIAAIATFVQVIAVAAQNSQTCLSSENSEVADMLPPYLGGFILDFEEQVRDAFPLGSCEYHLLRWLDENGFGEVRIGPAESVFVDEWDEALRNATRRREERFINARIAFIDTLFGRSVYSVGWVSDPEGYLIEIRPDSRINHVDLP